MNDEKTEVLFSQKMSHKHEQFDDRYHLPDGSRVDRKLPLGAALFGVGWGIVGIGPGPAFASLALGGATTGVIVLSFIVGKVSALRLQRYHL